MISVKYMLMKFITGSNIQPESRGIRIIWSACSLAESRKRKAHRPR